MTRTEERNNKILIVLLMLSLSAVTTLEFIENHRFKIFS